MVHRGNRGVGKVVGLRLSCSGHFGMVRRVIDPAGTERPRRGPIGAGRQGPPPRFREIKGGSPMKRPRFRPWWLIPLSVVLVPPLLWMLLLLIIPTDWARARI